MTPISGQRTTIETTSADALPALSSSPGKKKFSALPLRVAMNAAKPTPKSPDSACCGDSRRDQPRDGQHERDPDGDRRPTAFVFEPETVYVTTNATAGTAVSAMPERAADRLGERRRRRALGLLLPGRHPSMMAHRARRALRRGRDRGGQRPRPEQRRARERGTGRG